MSFKYKNRLIVTTTPNSLLSAILCLQHLKVEEISKTVLAISGDFASHSGHDDYQNSLRELADMYPWLNIIWFTGLRSMLSYHFPETIFPSPLMRRKMNENDCKIVQGVIAAAENMYLLSDSIGSSSLGKFTVDELWLEYPDFAVCRLFWRLLPKARKILYPHASDLQSKYDCTIRQKYAGQYVNSTELLLRSRIREILFADPISSDQLRWDEILTLNESPPMGSPIIDCSSQLEENILRAIAQKLPMNRYQELQNLVSKGEKDNTALLLLGNLGDQYLAEEIMSYKDLIEIILQRQSINTILIKAHPRHPQEIYEYISQSLQQIFPCIQFKMLIGYEGMPIELMLPFLHFCVCIAGWTSVIRTVFNIKKVPIFVGVSRLKPLVYSTTDRKIMFDDFLVSLELYAELI
ncbi:hypothetical protein [Anabaena sp. AL93]|jgi:hypothetical protein|uniref:hypothetical protein n=1 Tax=Anabaena sp. AL93 TaxID=1678133 RepID=UPI000800BEF0|nr:hypothetical protein [Anabaena sp. AL93]OBQ20692.1 MAG: hypothetical protein AN486_06095 [Anabaena sp. AL93]